MKFKFTIFLTLLFHLTNGFAQTAKTYEQIQDEQFVYLYDGRLLIHSNGDYKIEQANFLKYNYFWPNGEKIITTSIKFHQNDTGYFGNVRSVSSEYKTGATFVIRTIPGEINIYEVKKSYGPTRTYFSRQFESLQRLSYNSLFKTLKNRTTEFSVEDKAYVFDYLEEGKTKKRKKKALLIIGFGSAAISYVAYQKFANDVNSNLSTKSKTRVKVIGSLVGIAGLATAGFSFTINYQTSYRKAISAFNSFYD